MSLLPDWAPNIHPLIVHFPIALIFVAVLFDAAKLVLSKIWIEKATVALYIAGTLGLIASYWSGSVAAETVRIPVQAQSVMTDHENLALITLLYFLAFVLLRAAAGWLQLNIKRPVQGVFVLLGVLGCYFVWQTADLGARMVFEYGVGVAAVERAERESLTPPPEPGEISRPEVRDDGSWHWQIGAHASVALSEEFEWHLGTEDMISDDNGGLSISPGGETIMLVFGGDLRSVSAEADVNLDEFTGIFRIIYHFTDPENYGFMEVSEGIMRLGQTINGHINFFEEGSFTPESRTALRTSADGRHFYGFSDDEVIVHGHADELTPGSAGIYVEGSGTVKLNGMDVQSLRN